MKKLFSIILLSLLVVPVLVSAQPSDITEKCCKVGADLRWKGALNANANCAEIAQGYCPVEKGETIGPQGAVCSLPNINGTEGQTVDSYSPDWPMICLIGTIYAITTWIFFIMLVLAVVLIVIGGVFYMTAGGSPDKAKTGKNFIIFAIIGLAIALIARFLPPVVKFILGVS